jgi:hypothetical protein
MPAAVAAANSSLSIIWLCTFMVYATLSTCRTLFILCSSTPAMIGGLLLLLLLLGVLLPGCSGQGKLAELQKPLRSATVQKSKQSGRSQSGIASA